MKLTLGSLIMGIFALLFTIGAIDATPTAKKPTQKPSSGPPTTTTTTKPSNSSNSATPTSSSTASKTSGSTGNGHGAMTYEQFCQCIAAYSKTSAGGTPPCPERTVFDAYQTHVGGKMSLKEQAMFLANSIWETGGLKLLKEQACSNESCSYGKYYGRGYLQLTWDYNYKKASEAIYHDDTLVASPDKAAEQPGAWQTALWYWETVVHPALAQAGAIDANKLGYSVNAINGKIECSGGPTQAAQNRLAIYNEILKILNLGGTGTLEGCA